MIDIHDAQEKDVPGMIEVFYRTWLNTYPNEEHGVTVEDVEYKYRDRHSEKEIQRRVDQIRNKPDTSAMLVAKDGERVVGVCYCVRHEEHNQLAAIYVLPEYQGQGLGKRLWERGREVFDPDKKTIVEVAEYNQNAINFYKSLGFVDTGIRFTDEKWRLQSGAILPEMRMELKQAEQ